MKLNSTLKILSAFELGEQLSNKQIMLKVGIGLSKSKKSGLRNATYKLVEMGMLQKDIIGRINYYTLVKPKEEYTPRLVSGYNERKKTKPKEPKQLKPLEWYANMKVSKVLELSKQYKIPLPKTKEDIIKFHEMAISI